MAINYGLLEIKHEDDLDHAGGSKRKKSKKNKKYKKSKKSKRYKKITRRR